MAYTDQDIEYVEICTVFQTQTDKAVLVSDGDEDVWLPKSCVEFDRDFEDLERGDTITIQVAEWLAEQEGLV